MAINKGYLTAKTDKASDEYYTPREAVLHILQYIKPNTTVWCPFDDESSEYVKCLKEGGFKVIYSHIDEGKNFFYYEPEEPFNKRINFWQDKEHTKMVKGVAFASIYICKGFLPEKLIFEEL